jgi:glycosyltransferase involved in cell wall biosynthesis
MIWNLLSTLFKIIYWFALSVVIIMIILKFNLIPASFMKMLKNLKEKNTIAKILYYFVVSLPCLLTELLSKLFSAGKNSPDSANYLLLLLFLILAAIVLFPCIIRYFYTRTPWGLSQLAKSTYVKKLEAAQKAIESLETRINRQKMKQKEHK